MNKWLLIGFSTLILALGCASKKPVEPPPKVKMQKVDYSNSPAFREGVPTNYVVKKGDTLWDLANKFLNNPGRWKEIWYNNPKIKNPHLVYPGDTLSITMIDGERKLQVTSSENPVRGELFTGKRTADGRPIYDVSPSVHYEEIENPIPSIPYHAVAPFMSKNKVFESDFSNDYPYIVGDSSNGYLSLSGNSRIYAHGNKEQFTAQEYQVFRNTGVIKHPFTDKTLGVMATFVADLSLLKEPSGEDVAELTFSGIGEQPIYPNDILIPKTKADQGDVLNFLPSLPEVDDSPIIITPLENGLSGSQFQTLVIDQGSLEGIEPGNVFKIVRGAPKYGKGKNGESFKIPDYELGVGIAYRVYDNVSFVLVMTSNDVIYKNDRLVMP